MNKHNLPDALRHANLPSTGQAFYDPLSGEHMLEWASLAGELVQLKWSAGNLYIVPKTDDNGAIGIGNGTTDIDFYWFGGDSTHYLKCDVGSQAVYYYGVDAKWWDNNSIILGTGSDISFNWNATYLQAGSGLWSNSCPSPADPNFDSVAHMYFNDFRALAADYDATNEWTLTEDDADCAQAINADTACGTLTLTNKATTDDNAQQIQLQQESFKVAAGKKLWYETRIKCAAGATQIDWAVGLTVTEDLTGVADNMPANGIVFHKDDGDTNIDLSTSDNGTNIQSAAVGTATTGWVKLGFYVDGAATGSLGITPYVNDVAGTAITTGTYATMSELAPIFMVRNGDATTTQTMEIDYVKVIQLR